MLLKLLVLELILALSILLLWWDLVDDLLVTFFDLLLLSLGLWVLHLLFRLDWDIDLLTIWSNLHLILLLRIEVLLVLLLLGLELSLEIVCLVLVVLADKLLVVLLSETLIGLRSLLTSLLGNWA